MPFSISAIGTSIFSPCTWGNCWHFSQENKPAPLCTRTYLAGLQPPARRPRGRAALVQRPLVTQGTALGSSAKTREQVFLAGHTAERLPPEGFQALFFCVLAENGSFLISLYCFVIFSIYQTWYLCRQYRM